MDRRGFSLIELLIVVVVIGAMASMVFPRIGRELQRQNVRSARTAVTTMHARARATAIQRARAVRLVREGNQMLILSTHPVSGVLDTIDRRNLNDSYGVTVSATLDTLVFDPRGLGVQGSANSIVVTRGPYADTVTITAVGSIAQ